MNIEPIYRKSGSQSVAETVLPMRRTSIDKRRDAPYDSCILRVRLIRRSNQIIGRKLLWLSTGHKNVFPSKTIHVALATFCHSIQSQSKIASTPLLEQPQDGWVLTKFEIYSRHSSLGTSSFGCQSERQSQNDTEEIM